MQLWGCDLLDIIPTSPLLKGMTGRRFLNHWTVVPVCVRGQVNASLWESLLPVLGKWMAFQGRHIEEWLKRMAEGSYNIEPLTHYMFFAV